MCDFWELHGDQHGQNEPYFTPNSCLDGVRQVKEMEARFEAHFSVQNWRFCRQKQVHYWKQFWWSSSLLFSRGCGMYPVVFVLGWLDCHHESVDVCLIYGARWGVISRWKQSSGVVNMHAGATGFHHKHVKPIDAYPALNPTTQTRARPSALIQITLCRQNCRPKHYPSFNQIIPASSVQLILPKLVTVPALTLPKLIQSTFQDLL